MLQGHFYAKHSQTHAKVEFHGTWYIVHGTWHMTNAHT